MCLSMTGGEKAVSRALGAACILNIALNAALIPSHGAMGAVMASALSSVLWKFAVWLMLYQRFAILPAGLGLLIPGRNATGT